MLSLSSHSCSASASRAPSKRPEVPARLCRCRSSMNACTCALPPTRSSDAIMTSNAAAIAEAFDVMIASLERVGGKAQVQAFIEDLQRHNRAGTSGLLLGARDADAEQLWEDSDSIDAVEEGEANGNNSNGWHPEATETPEQHDDP